MLKRKLLWCLVISCFLLLMFGTGSKAKGREPRYLNQCSRAVRLCL